MKEQTAVLVRHQNEWVLVTDEEEPERVWQDLDAAMRELRSDGWQVAEGPASIRLDASERSGLWGYRLRRSVQ